MLLEFEVTNWKSFKDKNYITAIAGREEQHKERRAYIPKYPINVLPTLGIFGGNASGKSNLIDGIQFIKDLVVNYPSTQRRIPVENYILDEKTIKEDTEFYLQLLIDDYIYHYTIILNKQKIVRETLELENSNRTVLLFDRSEDGVKLGEKYNDNETLKIIGAGTRPTRLFLSNTIDQQVTEFKNVYNWFKDLVILSPDTVLLQNELNIKEYIRMLNNFLPDLDTGITKVTLKEIDINNVSAPREFIEDILLDLEQENLNSAIVSRGGGIVYIFEKKEDQKIKVSELVTNHKTSQGQSQFKISMESMGTQRAIELIPLFTELVEQNSVVIIDEIDRSLHTDMTRGLIEYYLDRYDKDSRSQLIFTTHDTNLMDQNLFRRDELWVVERNKHNESNIVSIGDYQEVKKNHNLESLYLQGRLGGTPRINI